MTTDSPASAVQKKMVNLFGAEKGQAMLATLLKELGLSGLDAPQDRLRLGNALIARGGVLEAVGRAIKIQALLHGAKDGLG